MKHLVIRMLMTLIACLLRIRYRITYKGLQEVPEDPCPHGTLFLPNHPAVIVDPLIVMLPLLRRRACRPLVIEYMYYQPLFHAIFRAIGALPIPNFSTGFNPLKLKRAERMLQSMSRDLKQAQTFVVYPAGTTKREAKEVIGGAFGVHQLVSENPKATIILVRTTGLWGSGFSRAATAGSSPDTKGAIKRGLWATIKNGLFFVPRRDVLVEFECAGADFPRTAGKGEFNRYLEQWYNRPFGQSGEPLTLVSYCFWKKEYLDIPSEQKEAIDISKVASSLQERVVKKVAELAKVPPEHVLPNLSLAADLGLDSIDAAELIAFLEEQFDTSNIVPEDLTTVGRLLLIASKQYTKKEEVEATCHDHLWKKERRAERLYIDACAETIPEAFLKACDKSLFRAACADSRVGVLSYYKVKRTVLILSEKIAQLAGEHVGILLPASCSAYIVILACQMAGKVPVMINWTVGGKHLESVVEASGISAVISSWTFLDKLENVDLSAIDTQLVMLEEMRVHIGVWDKLRGAFKAWLPRSFFDLSKIKPDSLAVILFTSGTEGMPKGVPLSHANILSNQRAALDEVAFFHTDALLAMLPPFHSFGFSITGLLPLLAGLRVVYYPNPTDSKRLAKGIEQWHVTALCSAPTFLKNIIALTEQKMLASVRLIISGAEKAPEALFIAVEKSCPAALFCEGYGITECGPVLTVNSLGKKALGVGKPLANVELLIVDPENRHAIRPVGQTGMVLARGPNVFAGYLHNIRDPFVTVDEKQWYETGDLGHLTPEGNLVLSGRLKRFVKIGGEMISLAAIEEALSGQIGEGLFVIMPHEETAGKTALVLFSTHSLEVMQVNQMLRKGGFSNIVKVDRIIHLETIPQTATGKVSYRQLEKMLC